MPQDPLNVLWIEPSFPGRLGPVADWLVTHRGYCSTFYCNSVEPREAGRWPGSVGDGLNVQTFNVGGVARESAVGWTQALERSLCYAFACGEVLEQKMPRPIDLIVARSAGLGSSLFAPVYYPGVPVVNLFDYYWHPNRYDLADEIGKSQPAAYDHWRRSANAIELLDLEQATLPWAHSKWQCELFPPEYRTSFFVQHDGVDTRRLAVSSWHSGKLGPRKIAGRTIPESTRVVSFVAQSLERLRGFDRFWKIAASLIRIDPNVLFVAIGQPITKRGLDIEYHNRNLANDLRVKAPFADPDRFWMLGPTSAAGVQELLASSDLHLAPARDYPVARSIFEAMSSGCVVMASDGAPYREVITDGENGLLLDGHDHESWVNRIRGVLTDLAEYRQLGDRAAELVRERYSHDVCLSSLAEKFSELVQRRG